MMIFATERLTLLIADLYMSSSEGPSRLWTEEAGFKAPEVLYFPLELGY